MLLRANTSSPGATSIFLIATAVLALNAGASIGQPSQKTAHPAAQQSSKRALSSQDKAFMHKVAKGGALQIALSKVEVQQGKNPKVKKLALQTVENMSKAGGMLQAIANGLGTSLPQQPPEAVQRLKSALAADNGSLVDSEYLAQLLPASTVAVNVFKDEIDHGKNPKLVHFAKRLLPKLKKHRKMVVALSEGGSANGQASSVTTGSGPAKNVPLVKNSSTSPANTPAQKSTPKSQSSSGDTSSQQ